MTDKSPIVEKHGDVTCISLGPEFENLDEQLLDSVRSEILAAGAAADPPQVLIDLGHVRFFGSSFIEVMFRIWNRVNGLPNGKFAISGLTDYCREVLEVTHLDQLWTIYPSREEALRDMQAG